LQHPSIGERSTEETRAWLLGSAVAGLNLLASLAEGEELEDVRASFLSAASVWAAECPSAFGGQPFLRLSDHPVSSSAAS